MPTIQPETSLLEWGNRVAAAAVEIEPFPYGAWAGSMRSRPADEVPPEYVQVGSPTASQNFLYLPRERGWKRRGGQTQLFDTFGSSAGLLPAKWSSKGRWLEEFN